MGPAGSEVARDLSGTSWGTYGPGAGHPFDRTRALSPVDPKAMVLELACRGDPLPEFISPPRPPVYSHTSALGRPNDTRMPNNLTQVPLVDQEHRQAAATNVLMVDQKHP